MVRQRMLTTSVPYNLRRCWGLRRVRKKDEDAHSELGTGGGQVRLATLPVPCARRRPQEGTNDDLTI